ncbi:MAG: ATP-binding protein [Rickettsiaceae bacterium]|nr:ATP-binding protein [Rickettsiaceae bacterium]
MKFIGRKKELEKLEGLSKARAHLVVIKGRRRIGKSRLVEEFAKGKKFIRISGIPPEDGVNEQKQRDAFALQLTKSLGIPRVTSYDWSDLFDLLYENIKTGKYVLLFDEISWMGSMDPTFLGKFKNSWDMAFSKINGLIFILCGSVSTWIEENIIRSTGFFGRISLYLKVEELSLSESNEFLEALNFKFSAHEKFKILSCTGGVPWYLEQIDGRLTADDNISRMFFDRTSVLFNEFNLIFHDLFGNKGEIYKKILERLKSGSCDLNEIAKNIDYVKSGALSKYLDNLIEASFISRDYSWKIKDGTMSRLSNYRLSDNYIRFYLKYIEPEKEKILSGNNDEFSMISNMPGWNAVMGLQFENLILRNRKKIKELLNIKLQDVVCDNPFFQRKTSSSAGCQIDYLIQTRFGTLFACEIKFSRKEISADIINEMQTKLSNLKVPRGFAVVPVLIHESGITDAVSDSSYFGHIIDFQQLLN